MTGSPAEAQPELSPLDVYLRNRRFDKAARYLQPGSHLLDIGCSDLALFETHPALAASGVGIDIDPRAASPREGVEIRTGTFPDVVGPNERFDAVTMLAVIEHVQPDELRRWAAALPGIVRPGGIVIITVPSPLVDHILHVLIGLRLIAGMAAHEHYGFRPSWVPEIFGSQQLSLVTHRRFQIGLNNLFVFRRAAT